MRALTKRRIGIFLLVIAIGGSNGGGGTADEAHAQKDNEVLAALGEPPIPDDNRMTNAKVELGKLLFFEPRLSGDLSTPCALCHVPEYGWGDSQEICRGYPGTKHWRNCQTIINSAYYSKLFWAGESRSLEGQAKKAASGNTAGNGAHDMMEERLRQVPEYVKRFKEVFGTERPEMADAWRAIAAYERTLVQTDTPFDNYYNGDVTALSGDALAGMALFKGKARCIKCHNGALLSDEKYYNIGVGPNKQWAEDPLITITFRYQHYARGVSEEIYRKSKMDLGLYYTSKRKADMGKFRTPSLRYLKYTAPFMHNGTMATLDDVIEFYNKGGGPDPVTDNFGHRTKSALIKPLRLSAKEKLQLKAFLESTSGDPILVEAPKLPKYTVDVE